MRSFSIVERIFSCWGCGSMVEHIAPNRCKALPSIPVLLGTKKEHLLYYMYMAGRVHWVSVTSSLWKTQFNTEKDCRQFYENNPYIEIYSFKKMLEIWKWSQNYYNNQWLGIRDDILLNTVSKLSRQINLINLKTFAFNVHCPFNFEKWFYLWQWFMT